MSRTDLEKQKLLPVRGDASADTENAGIPRQVAFEGALAFANFFSACALLSYPQSESRISAEVTLAAYIAVHVIYVGHYVRQNDRLNAGLASADSKKEVNASDKGSGKKCLSLSVATSAAQVGFAFVAVGWALAEHIEGSSDSSKDVSVAPLIALAIICANAVLSGGVAMAADSKATTSCMWSQGSTAVDAAAVVVGVDDTITADDTRKERAVSLGQG